MPVEIDSDLVMAGYLALCILLVVIVHAFRVFDQRALAAEVDDDQQPLSFFERPDRGLVILVFGIVAVIVSAYVGWRLPAEIQRIMAGGDVLALASDVAIGPLARAAQVVGGISFLLIALRLMRWSLIVTFALSMMGLGIAAYAYVFG